MNFTGTDDYVATDELQLAVNAAQEVKNTELNKSISDLKSSLNNLSTGQDKSLVDQKNFKPTWDGHDQKFISWKFKFTNLCCAKYAGADKILKWAQDEETAISISKAGTKIKEVEGLLDLNNQLYSAFSCLLENESI